MDSIVRSATFSGSLNQVFASITDYTSYPRYIAGVNATEVVDKTDPAASCAVKFDLKVIKKFHYTLDMYHSANDSITWQMRTSNLLSRNSGSWKLEARGDDLTHATYELSLGFKIYVPGRIIKKLSETSLPIMFKGIQSLIDFHISTDNADKSG